MQLRGLLFLGLLAGTEASRIVRRQDATGSSGSGDSAVQPTAADTTADSVSSTDAVVVSSSTTSVDETTSSSAPADDTTSSSQADITTSDSADTTITRTITVTDSSAATITKKSTVQKTVTSTVVVYSTAFKTETVTSSGETATSTVYETSTTWTNEKRDLAPRTPALDDYVFVDAKPTAAAELPQEDEFDLKALLRRNHLAKRATITDTVTVTVGGGDGKTVTNVVTQTVVSSTSSVSKVTKTVTETEAAGASTTITVTSTLVITSTRVTTGVVATQSVAETSSASSSSDSSSSSSSSSSGLSTGAKAGIGAGAGVVGLAALGIILWCCLKRRNKPSKSEIDDMFGSSEVPVGGRGGHGTSPHMAHANHGSESGLAPGRLPTMSSTAEGYRGTAIGDGRTGYAKPNTYGAAYNGVSPETTYSRTATKSPGGDDHLPEHPSAAEMHSPANTAELGTDNLAAAKWHQPNAAEIDSTQVSSPRGSEPAEHVYEMPAQPYR